MHWMQGGLEREIKKERKKGQEKEKEIISVDIEKNKLSHGS